MRDIGYNNAKYFGYLALVASKYESGETYEGIHKEAGRKNDTGQIEWLGRAGEWKMQF